jgi:hypothetical protein
VYAWYVQIPAVGLSLSHRHFVHFSILCFHNDRNFIGTPSALRKPSCFTSSRIMTAIDTYRGNYHSRTHSTFVRWFLRHVNGC